jgi:hypothetical protein
MKHFRATSIAVFLFYDRVHCIDDTEEYKQNRNIGLSVFSKYNLLMASNIFTHTMRTFSKTFSKNNSVCLFFQLAKIKCVRWLNVSRSK